MERPQVADRGMASNMEGSCEYIEYAVVDIRQGVILQLGGWLTTPHLKKVTLLRKRQKCLGLGLIVWYNISNGKRT